MKKTFFKSFLLSLLWLGIKSCVFAQGIVVNKTDGSKVFFKASEVLSVGVYGYGKGPDDDPYFHDWVDLDLPSGTLWATTNVGAKNPEDYGNYFAWGEIIGYEEGKTTFNRKTYKYSGESDNTLWKYCTNSSYGTLDNKSELEPEDDAATVNWGSDWQIPSCDQFKELINSCYTITEWTTVNGVYGRKITSKSNLKSIFLPAAGNISVESFSNTGSYGFYCSRSLDTNTPFRMYLLYFYSNKIGTDSSYDGGHRWYGRSVRPVRVQK